MPRRGSRVQISSSAPVYERRATSPPFAPIQPGEPTTVSATTMKQLDPTQVELEISISPEEFGKAQDSAFRKLVRIARRSRVSGRAKSRARSSRTPTARRRSSIGRSKTSFRRSTPRRSRNTRSSRWRGPRWRCCPRKRASRCASRPSSRCGPRSNPRPTRASRSKTSPRRPATKTSSVPSKRCARMRRPSSRSIGPVQARRHRDDRLRGQDRRRCRSTAVPPTGQQVEVSEERFIPGFATGIVGHEGRRDARGQREVPRRLRRSRSSPARTPSSRSPSTRSRKPSCPRSTTSSPSASRSTRRSTHSRKKLRGRLDSVAAQKARRQMSSSELLDKLVAANDFPLPQVLVEREIDGLLDESRAVRRPDGHLVGRLPQAERKDRGCAPGGLPRRGRAARQNDAADRGDRQAREDRSDPGRLRSGARRARAPVRAAARKDRRIARAQRRRAGRRDRPHEDDRPPDRTSQARPGNQKRDSAESLGTGRLRSWVTWFRWSSSRARAASGRTTSTRGCSRSVSSSSTGAIDDGMASLVIAQLLFLEREDADKDIDMYINSPGGSVTAGLAIYDTMQLIKPDVATICAGMAASMASILLTGGAPGKRYALPYAKILIHQPWVSAGGWPGDRHRNPRPRSDRDAAQPGRHLRDTTNEAESSRSSRTSNGTTT